jgi:hypothetical protein
MAAGCYKSSRFLASLLNGRSKGVVSWQRLQTARCRARRAGSLPAEAIDLAQSARVPWLAIEAVEELAGGGEL